jgi:manganese/zinc/iron transport system permease protein
MMAVIPYWDWSIDGPIIAAAVLCALSCALLGNFLVLRRMSMMGDAISHAVLPGLAIAFWITHSRESMTMLLGAAVIGVLTALFTQAISHWGKVESSASMGVVFTSLFALGLILLEKVAAHVDLDPGCVLYGALESVAIENPVGGLPRVVWVLGIVYVLNVVVIGLLFKEFKVSSFDPPLATTMGINSNLMHYLLMILVAATTVACFEAVGSILVVAMLIVPAATAYLLTDRLLPMIMVSQVMAVVCGVLGHVFALAFGLQAINTAGSMATLAGLIFLGVLVLSPRHGVVARLRRGAVMEPPAEVAETPATGV